MATENESTFYMQFRSKGKNKQPSNIINYLAKPLYIASPPEFAGAPNQFVNHLCHHPLGISSLLDS